MVSAALTQWRTGRASKLSNLLSAHVAVGGSKAGRRWATEELNHAIVLRLASEFQGFCRDLHDEAVGFSLVPSLEMTPPSSGFSPFRITPTASSIAATRSLVDSGSTSVCSV